MAYIWRETFSNIKHSGLVGVLSILIVALTMMVFNILLILANHLHSELDFLKKSPFVVAFLEDGLSDSNKREIQSKIENLPEVSSVRYVSKEDALRRLNEMLSGRKEVLEGLESINPLPSSFEIEIDSQFLDSVKDIAETIRKFPGVEDVQHAEEAGRLVMGVEATYYLISSILGLASVVIIFFSIMITAYMRRDEIKIMRLVGSTGSFIRLPLLLQGVIQGLIGSVLGLAALYGLFNMYSTFSLLFADADPTSFLPPKQIALVIGTGMFIGFLGGVIPLRKYIKI